MKDLMKSGNPNLVKKSVQEARKKTKWNILRGDRVQVVGSHPEAGKQGIVSKVFRATDRVLVKGVNMGVHRVKGNPDRGMKGTVRETERTIHYSNVNLVDPVTNQPTRVYRKFLEDGTKVRVAKRSGAVIPRPAILELTTRAPNPIVTDDDTMEEDAWATTYTPPAPLSSETDTTMQT